MRYGAVSGFIPHVAVCCVWRGEIMKSRKKAVAAIVLSVALLAACSSIPEGSVSSGEIVVPEMSSEDLLVSSLEYLLENEEETSKEQTPENSGVSGNGDLQDSGKDEEVSSRPGDTDWETEDMDAWLGSGTYQEGDLSFQAGKTDGNPVQEEEQKETAVIYYGKGGSLELIQETVEIGELAPDELIDALARHNIVPLLDTKVLSFETVEEDGKRILSLNLSKAFGEYLRTMSKEAECIIVASIVDTFLENYGADALQLMVEGEAVSTANGDYTGALGKCTPEELLGTGVLERQERE